jgi:hypothetical protein
MARVALLLAVLAFGLTTAARARVPHNDKPTPAEWAWEQIRNDRVANLNVLCGKPDPHSDAEWNDQRDCRQIPAQFLERILIVPSLQEQLPRHRVLVHGALIEEGLDLSDTDVTAGTRAHCAARAWPGAPGADRDRSGRGAAGEIA